MRPINKGESPKIFTDYKNAKLFLVDRLGKYCSYCERRIPTNISVEHIQPKGLAAYTHLRNEWTNFLLSCVNCNSAKGSKNVSLDAVYLPDRDNTFFAFKYSENGSVRSSDELTITQQQLATDTIELISLNKSFEENPVLMNAALERFGQRMEAWELAETARKRLEKSDNEEIRAQVVDTALYAGFFSIWMSVFNEDLEMRQRLINAFPGTATECFDPVDTTPVSPRGPAPISLGHCGKI